MTAAPYFKWEQDKLHLFLRVQPKSSKDGFAEVLDDRIKLRLTAPPVDGKANQYLIKYLAKLFKVPKNQIEIKRGETGRNKHIIVQSPRNLPALFSHD